MNDYENLYQSNVKYLMLLEMYIERKYIAIKRNSMLDNYYVQWAPLKVGKSKYCQPYGCSTVLLKWSSDLKFFLSWKNATGYQTAICYLDESVNW